MSQNSMQISAKEAPCEAIPKLTKAHDILREGPLDIRSRAAPKHAVQVIQEQSLKVHEATKNTMLHNVYGSHIPKAMEMERQLTTLPHRLPGLHHRNIALESLTGRDECIDFEDILADDSEAPDHTDFHTTMEARLGL